MGFEEGDIVIRQGLPDSDTVKYRKVVGISEFPTYAGGSVTRLWLADLSGRDDNTDLASKYRKIEPKFEVGKAYRRIDNPLNTAIVVSASDRAAIGWTVTGEIWSMFQKFRSDWEEIGVSITADMHKNLREMGVEL